MKYLCRQPVAAVHAGHGALDMFVVRAQELDRAQLDASRGRALANGRRQTHVQKVHVLSTEL
jgi:hypothetical protein